jgi:hypothetical protein
MLALALSVSATEAPGSAVEGDEVTVMPEGNPVMLIATGTVPLPPIATLRVCVLPG